MGIGYVLAVASGYVLAVATLGPIGKFRVDMAVGPLALVAVVLCVALAGTASGLAGTARGRRASARIAALVVIVCVAGALLWHPAGGSSRWRISREDHLTSDVNRLAWWCRRHTPRDALFLTPPEVSSFRLMSERATFIDYKGNGFTNTAIVEWYARLHALYRMQHGRVPAPSEASRHKVRDAYEHATAEQIAALAKDHGIRYFVARARPSGKPDYPFPLVHAQGVWRLYDVQGAPTRE